jgi:hypothetical protein
MLDQRETRLKSRRSLVTWIGIFLFLFLGQTSFGLISSRQAEAGELELSYEGTHIALSLKVLSKKASEYLSARASLPRQLATLCGIVRFESFLVDEGNQDVILVGQQAGAGSPLHLDDLVVAMRSIWGGGTEAVSCSLDPRRENISAIKQVSEKIGTIQSPEAGQRINQQVKAIWGSQLVRVGGVPRDSRYAHIMIDADYHMKRVSLGAQKLPGIDSYLDLKAYDVKGRIAQGDDTVPPGLSFNRFWFSVEKEFPSFTEDEGIAWLKACPIVLFTEKQMDASSGELYDVEEDDSVAIAYAKGFSDQFPRLAEQVTPYGDLRNLYLLKAVLESLRFRHAAEQIGLDMDVFLSQYACKTAKPMPDSLEGCVLSQEVFLKGKDGSTTYWYFPVTFGGVNMEMEVQESSFEKDESLKRVKSKALRMRPSPDALFWVFTIP